MSRIRNKKRTTVIAAFLVVAVAGAAFAYWTAGGSGEGTAATGDNVPLEAVQTSVITDMAPGVAPQTLSGTFNNPNDGPVYVTSVTASLDSVVDGLGAPIVGCTIADYALVDEVMLVGAEIAAGTAQGSWTGATIQFDNDPLVNQDACKNAIVNITYTII